MCHMRQTCSMPVMANLDRQLDWIYNHQGDGPLGTYVRTFPERFNGVGSARAERGWEHLVGWGLWLTEKEEASRTAASVSLCFLMLLVLLSARPELCSAPWLPRRDAPHLSRAKRRLLLTFSCFCQVFCHHGNNNKTNKQP